MTAEQEAKRKLSHTAETCFSFLRLILVQEAGRGFFQAMVGCTNTSPTLDSSQSIKPTCQHVFHVCELCHHAGRNVLRYSPGHCLLPYSPARRPTERHRNAPAPRFLWNGSLHSSSSCFLSHPTTLILQHFSLPLSPHFPPHSFFPLLYSRRYRRVRYPPARYSFLLHLNASPTHPCAVH